MILDPDDIEAFKKILGDGSHFGITLSYEVQKERKGIADALVIAEKFLDGSPSCLILGDNIFHGDDFPELLRTCSSKNITGATILGHRVPDPERFGVVTFNKNGQAINLEEKPVNPTSHFAVPGIYFYDRRAVELAKKLTPSKRGELEITDLNKLYLAEKTLHVIPVPEGTTWFDTGTYDSLLEASLFVQEKQKQTGKQIGNLESLAHAYGYIDDASLITSAQKLSKTAYGQHLHALLNR